MKFNEGVARRIDDGANYSAIENGSNAISYNAYRNYNKQKEWILGFAPQSRPVINITAGELNIRYKQSEINIRAVEVKPVIDYLVGGVNINVEQYGSIEINFSDNTIDEKI